MAEQLYDYGMIGLGTMGRNLALNMGDHGFSVAGFDKDTSKVQTLGEEAEHRNIRGFTTVPSFLSALKTPRVILMLVPAGRVVDSVIGDLKPLLSAGDLLVDCGNSHYTDTDRRSDQLEKEGLHFMGIGVSGGESGARHGPSIMPGGAPGVYARVAPMLEAVAAKVDGAPCVTWLGPRSAGHYVKMVHNGIEYGLMQLISEAYHLLKEAGGLDNDELHALFARWNERPLQSFLTGITADIFARQDDLTGNRLLDMIRSSARQKGTGMWTSQDAFSLHIPIPTIDMAVAQRDLSALAEERAAAEKLYPRAAVFSGSDKAALIRDVEHALQFSSLITYAQGMSLLHHASAAYGYGLDLEKVAGLWRGGCIIRAALLEDIRAAYAQNPGLPNLLLDEGFARTLTGLQEGMRNTIKTAVDTGIPVPAMMACLSYSEAYRREWLPANLIQAQRDYFGAHTYERTDREGVFHTHWENDKS